MDNYRVSTFQNSSGKLIGPPESLQSSGHSISELFMKETMSSSSEHLTFCSNGVTTGHPTHFMRHEVKHGGLNPVWPQMCSTVASGATIPQELQLLHP